MPKNDRGFNLPINNSSPIEYWESITPSDTVELMPRPVALICLTTGNLTVKDRGGTSMLLSAVAANARIDISPTLVMATGTTGTWMGLYR